MAHVFLEKKQYSTAKDLLNQAHKNALKYNVLVSNVDLEKRVAQLGRADRATLRLWTVIARQLAGHDAAKEASRLRLWLLEDLDAEAQWPPLPIDENAEETVWMTPTRRRHNFKVKTFDSPSTLLTETSCSFDMDDEQSCEQSCDTQDTAAASFFRNVLKHKSLATSVPTLVPSDPNVYARDNKVFLKRRQYLDLVAVRKTRTLGRTSATTIVGPPPQPATAR
jgi:hypothetical protein